MADSWFEYGPSDYQVADIWANANVPVGDEWFGILGIVQTIFDYIALFRLQPLTASFKLQALTSQFDIGKLQAAFALLESLCTQYEIEFPLIDAFDIDPFIDQTFGIDSDLSETKHIQPNQSGTLDKQE